ncbi:MAG: hypothetical protein WCA35_08760 [Kovacikia sp.]
MAILKANQATILTQDLTKPTSALSPDKTYAIAAGVELDIQAIVPAINRHVQVTLKQAINSSTTWYANAEQVSLIGNPFGSLDAAKDRTAIFNYFLSVEMLDGSNQNHLSYLDRGVASSSYAEQIEQYPQRLQQKPDGKTVTSLSSPLKLTNRDQTVSFDPYPKRGVMPTLDQTALNFLHADIKEACLCIGSIVNGQMNAHWVGKNALNKGQFWSATKIVPLMNVVCQANKVDAKTPIRSCVLHDPTGSKSDISFLDAAIDIISYTKDIAEQKEAEDGAYVSNSLSALMKRFSSFPELEKWFSDITGNKQLSFRGYYGPAPLIQNPQLCNASSVILNAHAESAKGENLITAYDLTRMVTTLGWHHHISADSHLPAAQWHSLETLVRAMGYDTARYVDAAIAVLGIQSIIQDVVILSKLGFGASDLRHQTELVYTALVQFTDLRPTPNVLRSVGMTFRSTVQKPMANGDRDLDEEARWIDARMAAEVTEVLRRIMTQELA